MERDILDITVREFLKLLAHGREQDEWINVRKDHLPWRQIVDAAERGECTVARAGRKLMMRRSELDRWLESQAIGVKQEKPEPVPMDDPDDVSHLLAKAGYGRVR